MNNLIQWPRAQYWDKPWNPIIGCQPCSPACENCYAKALSARFGMADFSPRPTTRIAPPRSGVVFCGNMTDLFGEWNAKNYHEDKNFIGKTVAVGFDGAIYLWLTKRVETMITFIQYAFGTPWRRSRSDMHYFGFTAENQQRYSERLLPVYRAKEKWMQFWVSAEPLLGPLRLGLDGDLIPGTYKWIVVGCESGPNRRPCKIEWVESIVEQCRAANVPVFVKQLDLNGKCERDISKFPEHLRIRQVPWAKGETK